LTASHGKVRGIAKGARRPKSKFSGRLEVTNVVHLSLHRGRSELGVVRDVDLTDGHPTIRTSLDRLTGAMAILEVADQLAQNDLPDPRLFQMVIGCLDTFDDPQMAANLIAPAFFLKALVADGVGPEVEVCASCGSDGPLVAFALFEGGLLCAACRRGRPVSEDAVLLLRRILGGGLRGVLADADSPAAGEVAALAAEAMEAALDRRLKTLRSTANL
jgi:DNA repair protein RecO (recombination protein O)